MHCSATVHLPLRSADDPPSTGSKTIRAGPREVASTSELMGDRMPPAADQLDGRVLELVVSAWLNSLAEGVAATDVTPDVESFLIASGLQRTLSSTGTAVAFEVA